MFQRLWSRLSGAPEREAHERLLQASQLALVNLALVNFGKALAAQACQGDGLQEDVLARIKADCIAARSEVVNASISRVRPPVIITSVMYSISAR